MLYERKASELHTFSASLVLCILSLLLINFCSNVTGQRMTHSSAKNTLFLGD